MFVFNKQAGGRMSASRHFSIILFRESLYPTTASTKSLINLDKIPQRKYDHPTANKLPKTKPIKKSLINYHELNFY